METIWQHVGVISQGGTVASISGGDSLWLVTEAGIFWQNAAGAWTPLPYGQPAPQINALAVADRTLIAADVQGQIFYSTNEGRLWYRAEAGPTPAPVTWLVAAPDFKQSGVALAGTDGAGVLRTTNGGRTWQPANFGLQDFSVLAMAAAPRWERRELVFLATVQGLYRSPNGGRAWKRADKGLEGALVQALAVSPDFDRDRTVLAGTETGGIFRSTDGGKSWQPAGSGLSGAADEAAPSINALWLHPDFGVKPVCVAAAGDGQIFRSDDGGDHWQPVARAGAAVLCLGGQAEHVYAGLYRDGLLGSADGGQSWQEVAPLAARAITRLHPGGQGLFAFGPLGQAWVSHEAGQNWQSLPGLPGETPLLALAAGPIDQAAEILLAATPAGLWRSTQYGQAWQTVLPEAGVLTIHFSADFGHDQTVWVGTSVGGVLVSTDAGQTWSERQPPQPGQMLVRLACAPNLVVAATWAQDVGRMTLWRSTDNGLTWQQWQQVNTRRPWVNVEWLGQKAIVGMDRRCWLNTSAGWEKVLETEQPLVRLARLAQGTGLLALTSRELFFTADGSRWAAWTEGLPEEPLLDLAVTLPDQDKQLATLLATGGRLWQRQL
ncbi:MAG: hypothetical protein AB1801_08260 [Chloroflexota bacterium]